MLLRVKEVDGKLVVVGQDEDGNYHIIKNINDGSLAITCFGFGSHAASLEFTFNYK